MENDNKKMAPQDAQAAEKKHEDPTVLAPQKRTFIYTFAVGVLWVVFKILFFMKFEGRENIEKGKNVVLMGNHQCMLDPVCLALCVPDREIHFMGKKELWNNKLVAWLWNEVHGFPVDRGNFDMGAIRTAMNILKSGASLGIFPEGTRDPGPEMLPLLSGASMLALRSKVDVVPIYIDGNYKPFRKMVVRVGKPVNMDDLTAGRVTKDSCEELTKRIEQRFFELSGGKSRPKAIES